MPELEPLLKKPITAACSDSALLELIIAAPLPSLATGPRVPPLADWLRMHASKLPDNVAAGLWLLAGDLNASHGLSEQGGSAEADFWHAIMHRREGDFSNAKYWFRRVGRHAVLRELADTDYGDPMQFVDRCQRATAQPSTTAQPSDDQRTQLMQAQWAEWQRLWLASWPLD